MSLEDRLLDRENFRDTLAEHFTEFEVKIEDSTPEAYRLAFSCETAKRLTNVVYMFRAESEVPRLADHTAAFAVPHPGSQTGVVPQAGLGWPTIPGVTDNGLITTRYFLDFGPMFEDGILSNYPLSRRTSRLSDPCLEGGRRRQRIGRRPLATGRGTGLLDAPAGSVAHEHNRYRPAFV